MTTVRSRSGALLLPLVLAFALTGCGSGGDGEEGAGDPGPSASGSETPSESPTEEPTVEPATGPEVELLGGVSMRAPEDATWSDIGSEAGGVLQSVANVGDYSVLLQCFPAVGGVDDLSDQDLLDGYVKGTGQRLEDRIVSQVRMVQVAGVEKVIGGQSVLLISRPIDGFEYRIQFNFEKDYSDAEREDIVAPVLATVDWG